MHDGVKLQSHSLLRLSIAKGGLDLPVKSDARATWICSNIGNHTKLMRLLHVICTTDSESGGPIEAIRRISEVLMRNGIEVTVASLESTEEAAGRNFPFEHIAIGKGWGKYRFSPRFVSWLGQHAGNFDAVIVHGLWNFASFGAWRALRRLSTPYFVFVHGMMDPWFREHYPAKHVLKQIYWIWAEGRVLRDARKTLFTCEEEMLRARGVFRGYSYREQVALYGTAPPAGNEQEDRDVFLEKCPHLAGRRFLLFLGRIHPKKGCDLLVKAYAQCVAVLPEELDLVVAGPDQIGWMRELAKLAAQAGISHRVHWVGMLKGAAKWGALRAADALIIPSHQENFGFVVAESMACGTPVLISDKINIWREVLAAKAGLVESDTLEGTVQLIRRFTSMSVEEVGPMRMNAREGFRRYFDIQVTAMDFARIIRSNLEQKRPSQLVQ